MTEATREYGLYADGVVKDAADDDLKIGPAAGATFGNAYGMLDA